MNEAAEKKAAFFLITDPRGFRKCAVTKVNQVGEQKYLSVKSLNQITDWHGFRDCAICFSLTFIRVEQTEYLLLQIIPSIFI